MNKIQLAGQRDFALTTDALAFMQDASEAIAKLVALGGDNYILSGCVTTGTSVSSGWIVLKGKLMPFVGGTIQSYVRIIETVQTVTVDIASRQQTTYHAEFGTSSNSAFNVEWSQVSRHIGENLYRGTSGSAEGATKEGWYKTPAPAGSNLSDGIAIVKKLDDNRIYVQFQDKWGYTAFRSKEGASWTPWRVTSVEGRSIGTFDLSVPVNQGWENIELSRLRVYDRHVFFEFIGLNDASGVQQVRLATIPLAYRPNYIVPVVGRDTGKVEINGEVNLDNAAAVGIYRQTANWFID